jgi:hypothetical protein
MNYFQSIFQMSSKTRPRKIPSNFEKTFMPNSSSALARTHRIIRIEKEKEILFMSLCSQIHFDDFKKNRSERQREERRQKREKVQIT